MTYQEKFEQWWGSDTYSIGNDYKEDTPIYCAHIGWQAAKQDSAAEIAQLQADNLKLREALVMIADESAEELWQGEVAREALASTPAQSRPKEAP